MIDWSKMPPVSLPFEMPDLFQMLDKNQKEEGEEPDKENGLPFPFSLLSNMQELPSLFLLPVQLQLQVLSQIARMVKESAGESGGENAFAPFGFPIPEPVLQKLLQMDASPKTLERLQRFLDFAFEAGSHQD